MQAFVYDAVRTPFGRYGGALAGARPDDLAAFVVAEQVRRAPNLDPALVDEVILGDANGAGEDNRDVARMAVLLAGLPLTVPGSTVNRLCGSSLEAAVQAARAVETGDAEVVVAGGVESMSRAPWVVRKPERAYPAGDADLVSSTLGWRLVNPRMAPEWTVSLGEATERLREKHGITRERQDEFALRSHRLAHAAWEAGRYDDLVTAYTGPGATPDPLARDEPIRPDTGTETLATLRPSFRPDGTVTAGNASPLTDGASAALIGSERAAELTGLTPLARIAGRAAVGNEPRYFGYAPVEAAHRALGRSGIEWDDVGAVELNEAFAAQALACLDAWPIAPEIVNAWGGAIAVGHPLGASGTRVLATLARRMRSENVRWGVAAICIGVGQGMAVVLENTDVTP
ncbi:thiolase family protein [Myceligenerans pegani]|uniref:Probable acetyl-CoA acetyltransferase n=1 Tax=Myceligenerans pegani TaxID=2776917 RepID=A0ABR9N7I4_9MICO|nr:thiolase family protein [Myceligenerans sp. TRM 65318]MBE1879007.1 thiolase family protein [Myceligenerans sp. TRM 65318]MBE3021278.1 thiolase family protein [Myceligenerans sp. TRM 65318]